MLRKIKFVISLFRYFVISSKLKDCTLCIISAIILITSFPNLNFWIFAWFGFVPLFFAIKNKSRGKAFLFSYFTGFIFWGGIIYWLVHVTLTGTIALILYLALYFGIFGVVVSTMNYKLSTMNLFFIPSIWVILEYLRSHLLTGFPWALLGYSQYLNFPIIQIADITGVWGISFLIMMLNLVIYKVIGNRLPLLNKKNRITVLLPIMVLVLTLGYGYYRLNLLPTTYNLRPIRISLIQGNIPQELKWDIKARDFIIAQYLALTQEVTKDRPDLIIWPEATLPVVLEEEPEFFEKVKNLVQEIKTPLLFGAVTSRDNFYYNSALLLSRQGEILKQYDKLHLVPFGEYIPLRENLPFLQAIAPIGDFSRGKEYSIFSEGSASKKEGEINFSVLICFEDVFPELSREFVKKGAALLVNITNDAWFKQTSSPYQHLQASVFRAIENRVFLARAANTGVSGFIAPTGKIISLVRDKREKNIFISGYHTEEIAPFRKNQSFYTRYGDLFIIACLFLIFYYIIALRKDRKRKL